MVKAIPDNYPRVSAYLTVGGAAAAIDFYCSVFGATERYRINGPGGTIGHAELAIGDSLVMLADENPDWGNQGPKLVGGTPVTLSIYVEDVDAVFADAIAAGATAIRPVEDQFYGDRSGSIEDPFGHRWMVASHIEDVSPEEIGRRAAQFMGGD